MIEVPPQFKQLADALDAVVTLAKQVTGSSGPTAGVEGLAQSRAADVERALLGIHLRHLDLDAPQVSINGVTHTKVGRYPATFYTSCGAVEVTRTLYREAGARNAPTVDLVGLQSGAVRGFWLPDAARHMAWLLQLGTSREAEATSAELGRVAYARSSFEDVGHAVGSALVADKVRIEAILAKERVPPANAHSVSVSVDRVSLPMEEDVPRPVGRPRKDAPKRNVTRVFRMAYCATVTLHDATGEAISSVRRGLMPDDDTSALGLLLSDNVKQLLAKNPALKVVLLADGAPEMWNIMESHLNQAALGVTVTSLLDLFHLLEKLAAAAKVIHGNDDARKVVHRWHMHLLNTWHAAEEVLAELQKSNRRYVQVGDGQPVHEAITYLENHRQRMRYSAAKMNGLPLGSGNVEATCKSLVEVRMRRPGARWRPGTGADVMHLRAAALSGQWARTMELLMPPPSSPLAAAA